MHPTSKFYNYLVSYTINVLALQLSTILYYQFRRFTTLYFLIQSTSTFYNSLLSYTTNFEVLQLPIYQLSTSQVNVFQLSSILYNKPPTFYNSLLSYTINFDVLQLSTILYNQLRRFTTLYYPMHPTSKFYNYLVSYTINVLALQLSTILYYQFRRFTSTSTFYNSLPSYTTKRRSFTTLYYVIQ